MTNKQVTKFSRRTTELADPGFLVGGRGPRGGGAWTPEAVKFQKFCMLKRKNLDPLGGRAPGTPPRSANDIENLKFCGGTPLM